MILNGRAAAEQEHRVQHRHGKRPEHNECPGRDQDRHVVGGPTRLEVSVALDVERGRQVEFGLRGGDSILAHGKVIVGKALALEGEEEPAHGRFAEEISQISLRTQVARGVEV